MKKKTPKISGHLYREVSITREAVDEKDRTVTLSFSSEAPVSRWDWFEVLDHAATSVRLDRLRAGGALLVDHNRNDVVGIVESVEIGQDRKGRAVVRFGKSARASEVFADVVDGIRKNVSVGYRVHKMKLEKEEEEGDTYRVTDWEPLEISLVSIPADVSVGVGRSAEEQEDETLTAAVIEPAAIRQEKAMEKCSKCGHDLVNGVCHNCALDAERTKARGDEQRRVADIMTIGEKANCRELATAAIREGKSVDDFRAQVLEEVYKAKPAETPEIGMTPKEAKRFSIVRVIQALSTGKRDLAPFEFECSDAVAQKMRKSPQGCFVPYDVTYQRDLVKGTATAGGYTVATDLLAASFIELLRNRMVIKALGARILGGLVGDIAIPKQTGGATAYWVGENTAPTESQQTIGQVAMTPKTVGAFTDMSRKLIMQSSIDVESFVRGDLAAVLALAIDLAAIAGAGAAGEPHGIIYTTGIGSVAGGTNGAYPTWAHIVDLETEVAVDNADVGSLAYLTNARIRGKLKQTQKVETYGDMMVWENGQAPGVGMLNGYPAYVSNQVPATLTKGSASTGSAIIFGNWSDLIFGEWGALDVLVDPYTGGAAGTVRVRLLQDVDVAVRHAQSFAAMLDAAYSYS